jgi:hypothetical protein
VSECDLECMFLLYLLSRNRSIIAIINNINNNNNIQFIYDKTIAVTSHAALTVRNTMASLVSLLASTLYWCILW